MMHSTRFIRLDQTENLFELGCACPAEHLVNRRFGCREVDPVALHSPESNVVVNLMAGRHSIHCQVNLIFADKLESSLKNADVRLHTADKNLSAIRPLDCSHNRLARSAAEAEFVDG